jgi:predicted Zn finger-like uncharacterized protein
MKITCHACAAKYTVSDEKVQGKTVKMKCRKCGATIVVGGTGAQEGDAAVADDGGMAQAEATPAGSFLVNVADGDQRTMTMAEIVEAYNASVVTADTYVWSDVANDWQALGENETIVSALNAAAGGGAAAAPAYGNGANGNGGYGGAAPYAEPSTPAAAAPMAMASDSGRGAAKKERKAQDLFGGGYNDAGLSSSAGMASASPSAAGKRDENSVLFSLSALTATTGPAAPAPTKSQTTATKEDSGLIDLKALAASAPPPTASQQAASSAVDTIGLFPLGAPVLAPPPVAAMAAPVAVAAPQEKSKLPLIIGGVVAVAAVVGVFMVVKGGGGETAASAAKTTTAPTAEAAPTAPPPVATAVPTETAAAVEADASASAAATSKPVAGNWKKGGAAVKGTATAGGGTPAGATATAAKTAAPARGNCGCAPSDLNCAMKCAAKGGK